MRIERESLAFVLIASIILVCSTAGAAQVFSTSVPISFIQNNGQTDEQVLYFADAAGYTLYLTGQGEVISTAEPVSVITVSYTGSNPSLTVVPEDELAGKANFLLGNDEEKWVTGVPMYASVRYDGLYDGVSLVYHGGPGILKREFMVAPGADPSVIVMKYDGQEGLSVDESGALLVTTAAGIFFETPPVCYQMSDGRQVDIPCSYVIDEDGVVTFAVGAFDMTLPLIIDPEYDFSTYLGGTQDDKGAGIGMDDWGNVYVVGSTQSTQFPLSNGAIYQEHLNGSWDIFVTKFGPDQPDGPIYSTYIGGKSEDLAGGMVVNNFTGQVTFTGSTKSTDYPNSYPTLQSYGGNTDAIVTRLNDIGNAIIWSRLINGNKTDVGTAVTLDDYSYNDAVVAGYTSSDNLTAIGWVNTGPPLSGATDGFVLVITSGGILSRGRYLGGTNYDYAYGVAVDPSHGYDTWITGATKSLNFPTMTAFRNDNRGKIDAFITRLNWGDLSLGASTYLGGSGDDAGTAIDIDFYGYPYITGYTESPVSPISLFPIKPYYQAFQTSFGGGQWDAFITKMERNLTVINYSTYLGGLYDEKAYGIAVDNMSTAYVTGYTNSENFPLKCEIQPAKGLGYLVPDAFITQINQTGKGLLFSTYLGGTYYDEGKAIAITDDGLNITVTGYTESINFPIEKAYQPSLAGFPAVRFTDAFVTKIVKIPPVANITATPLKACSPALIQFEDNSTNNPNAWLWEFGDNTDNSTEQNPTHTYYNNGSVAQDFTVNLTAWNCDGWNTTSRNVTICPNLWYNFTSDNAGDPQPRGCVGANDTFTFTGVPISGSPVIDWWFDFGDNTTVPHMVNVHQFTNTSNYTVTFWVQSECCNNSSTMVVDMRAKPVADFNATPISGLVPLDVNFFDNSSGRPSTWFWRFGSGEGTSTDQNPEHTYNTKGAYTVRLEACNFCGCDWENKTAYIKAGVPNLSFMPDDLIVPTNDTTPIELYLQVAESGLSGYDLKVQWGDSVHGNITSVKFPTWAYNQTVTGSLPAYMAEIKAVDLFNAITPGATNILLGTFNLTGRDFIPTYPSTIWFNVSLVNELDDNFGNPIYTNNLPATITVVRLLPFPGPNIAGPPTDPDGDQKYWDVNGNGWIDFADVVKYFQNMQWIRDNQYKPFFDYNGNGLIDFADLIMLFNKV